jgi:RimJ/RimL family protein N-acetyltransferase
MVRLEGKDVVVRPVRSEELDALCQGSQHLDDRAQPTGPPTRERLERRIDRSGRWTGGRLDLGIEANGRLVGEIQALRGRAWNLPPGVAQLGIAIFDPADRGKGIGSTAVALLTAWLFEHGATARVQAGTAVDNLAMRRVFERLGFACEGVMRAFIAARSGREDCALYAVTKGGWQAPVLAR